jgi:hypothetical protein
VTAQQHVVYKTNLWFLVTAGLCSVMLAVSCAGYYAAVTEGHSGYVVANSTMMAAAIVGAFCSLAAAYRPAGMLFPLPDPTSKKES